MLNIGRLGVDGAAYYLETIASGVEDYYTGSGEAPGFWTGSESATLGLAGEVAAENLQAVLAGLDPATGTPLGSGRGRKVPGFDLTFRAPKSLSLLWALGDRSVADEAREAHDAAVDAALGYLEQYAARSRRGSGGAQRVAVGGFVAAAFRHRSSRAGDPLLHTHVLVANLARARDDGRWRTLDSRRIYAHAKTAGYVYQAHLRHELTRRLGVQWQPVVNGWADLAGVPQHVIRAFSQRRVEIEAHMAARGESSAAAAQTATLATRKAKDYGVTAATLHQRWADRATTLGFTAHHAQALLDQARQPTPSLRQLTAELLGPDGLTAQTSTFDRRDVVRAWCNRLPAGATAEQVDALTDALLAEDNPHIVRLDTPGEDARWSTLELLTLEHDAITTATSRHHAGVGVANPAATRDAVARRPSLSDEQAAMVHRLVSSGAGVDVVVGKAGAGKTFALDAARDAWTTSGHRVIGCAVAARAAAELQAGAGIPSSTLHALLTDLDHGNRLPANTVVVVDEAGMAGTRHLAKLLDHAQQADAKTVLVGDPYQLPAVDAGGLFAGLATRLPVVELTDNRRQHHAWERAALDELRAGSPAVAVQAFAGHGRIVAADTADAAREELVGDWWTAREEHGRDAVMIAARRSDVDDLNTRARHRMATTGLLTGPVLETAGRAFQTGDEILCLRNHRRLGVTNGTRGTITTIDPDTRTVRLLIHGGRKVTLPAWYLDGGHLTHGYAITGHKAQGITCDETFVLGSDTMYREWGYTALSRGRAANRLYLVAGARADDDAHTRPSDHQRDPLQRVGDDLHRSRAKHLAVDGKQPAALPPQPRTPAMPRHGAQASRFHMQRLLAERRRVRQHIADAGERLHVIDERLDRLTRGLSRLTRRNEIARLQTEHARITADLAGSREHLLELDRQVDKIAGRGHGRARTEISDFATLTTDVAAQRHSGELEDSRLSHRNRDHTVDVPRLDREPPGLEIA